MATQLELVNRLLRRLREDSVTGTTDNNYARLLAEIVADSYEEVASDDHMWEAFKHRTHVDITAGTNKYELTRTVANGGNVRNSDGRVPKTSSELQWINGDCPEAWLYESDSDDEPDVLIFLTPEAFRRIKGLDRDDTEDDPIYFTVYPEFDGTNERLYLELFPEPAATRVVELYFWTIPDRLKSDGTTDGDTILGPERVVYQLAMMYALNERGEELGEPGNLAERRYIKAMRAAIEKDIDSGGRGDRYEWRRD